MSKLLQRIIIAAAMIIVIAAALYFNGWVLAGALVILGVLAEYEMVKTVNKKGEKIPMPILLIFAGLLPAGYYFMGFTGAIIVIALCLSALFISSIISKNYGIDSVIKGIFAFIYPQILFLFLYATVIKGDAGGLIAPKTNRFVILATALVSIMTDTLAYFIGSAIGKHKLCPQISPKKSVEGAVGGLIGGVLGAAAMIFFLQDGVDVWAYLIFALIISALAQFGDLCASLVKRKFDIKDYSRIFGEHGGIMDRMDSILFIMPYSYIFFFVICGL